MKLLDYYLQIHILIWNITFLVLEHFNDEYRQEFSRSIDAS